METLIYILEAGICYAALSLVYFLLFRNSTHFQANRFYLLLIIPLAFILPQIDISTEVATQYQITLPVFEVNNSISETMTYSWKDFILLFYYSCSSIVFIKFSTTIFNTLKTIKSLKQGIAQEIQPFSFFRFIYVSEKIEEEDRNAIIAHEKVHSKQLHSIDITIYEISKILLWWNPFLWIGINSVKSNHEFIADKFASEKADKYSSVLVAQLLGVNCSALANNFKSKPLIKKRIMMMNKKKSNRLSVLKYALVIPIIGLTIMATTNRPSKANFVKNIIQNEDEKVYKKVDVMPEFKGGNDGLMKYLGNNITYPEKLKEERVQGMVVVNFVIDTKGKIKDVKTIKSVHKLLDAEAIRVINNMPKWKPGKHNGKKVNVSFNIPIQFTLKD